MNFDTHSIDLKYDANGNLTNDGVRSYTYDAENRLIECSTSVSLVNYIYDGLGRKVSVSSNVYAIPYSRTLSTAV